MFCLTGYILLT